MNQSQLILISLVSLGFASSLSQVPDSGKVKESEFEILPIITYDTDAGFGYGGKAFFLSFLKRNESFDISLFNSTKGERWYRFVFSLPDAEVRQGKKYDFALNFIIDYDKWINFSFFGIGNNSSYNDEIKYTREPIDIKLFISRGFSSHLVTELGLRYNSTSNYRIPSGSILSEIAERTNSSRASLASLSLSLRYDTRKSFINPFSGIVVQTEIENAFKTSFTNSSFTKLELTLKYYTILLFPELVFAGRVIVSGLTGGNIPVQYLLASGGNRTLRGYTQDRFLDKTLMLLNSEFRFPIYWRIGGIAGLDAGKVWQSLSEINFNSWALSPVIGLRLYMDNFIARADIGFSKEIIGFYFNFGHIF